MTTEIEKRLAIMLQEEEDFCIVDTGDREDVRIYSTDKTQSDLEVEWDLYDRTAEDEGNTPMGFLEWLEENYEQIDVEEYDMDDYNNDWLVCTDSEADDKWEQDLDSYIDDCVLPEIPEAYRNYFDDESFKRDCKYDGRGQSLAKYDGHECYQDVNGTTYYLYRQN